MAAPQVSREALQAMAEALGFEIDDARADELVPQVQRAAQAIARLDESLDLGDVEPATIFAPREDQA